MIDAKFLQAQFMAELLGEFNDMIEGSMAEGHYEEFDGDHLEFLLESMKTFVELRKEEAERANKKNKKGKIK